MTRKTAEDVEDIPEEQRSLGDRLLLGVTNLWKTVSELKLTDDRTQKTLSFLMSEIDRLKADVTELKSKVHGLSVKAGKAKAAKTKLERDLTVATQKLDQAKNILLH